MKPHLTYAAFLASRPPLLDREALEWEVTPLLFDGEPVIFAGSHLKNAALPGHGTTPTEREPSAAVPGKPGTEARQNAAPQANVAEPVGSPEAARSAPPAGAAQFGPNGEVVAFVRRMKKSAEQGELYGFADD